MDRSVIFTLAFGAGIAASAIDYFLPVPAETTSPRAFASTRQGPRGEELARRIERMLEESDPYNRWRAIGDQLLVSRIEREDDVLWSQWRDVGLKLLDDRKADPFVPYFLRWHSAHLGQREEALALAIQAVDRHLALGVPEPASEGAIYYYNLACFQSLARRSEEALEALTQAIDRGYRDHRHASTDPDLRRLRRDQPERFSALLDRIGGFVLPTASP
jgi:tetratricopeptide (TPR) repeat protein